MKSTMITRGLAIGLFVLYILWSLFNLPFTNILVSASIGLISYGSSESVEVSCVAAIAVGVVFYAYRSAWFKNSTEGFEANSLAVIQPSGPAYDVQGGHESSGEGGFANGDDANTIAKRIAKLSRGGDIKGMLSADYLEGFADASAVDNPVPDAGSKAAENKKEDSAAPPSTAPAPVKDAGNVSDALKNDMPAKGAVEQFAKGNSKMDADNTALFRLGSIPTDMAGGPHIDAGSTLMNALNALKPDQIKSMTEDTQKLMETQKNLMGMLQSMKPILQDGKQMMETFGTLFNK